MSIISAQLLTLKIRTYKNIADEYFFIDTHKALEYSRIGLKCAVKINWKRAIGAFNAAIGQAYSDKGNYDSCLYFYQKALILQTALNDKINMASTRNNMGAAEQNIVSNYPKATQHYFEALKLAEATNDKYLTAICYDNIAQIYLTQKNYPKALHYGFKSLQLRQQTQKGENSNVVRDAAQSFSRIASIYLDSKDYKNAKIYLQKAIQSHQKTGNKEGLAGAYANFSLLFDTDYRQKIEYALKAKALWDNVNPLHPNAITNVGNLGVAYLDSARYKSVSVASKNQVLAQAERYLRTAIALSPKKDKIGNEAYWRGLLAELQAEKGDYKNAYLNFRTYQNAQDSLYSQENKNQIAAIEGQREIALRDKHIEINNLELITQRKQQLALLIGVALLAVIGGLLYWQNQTRKRTNTTLLHLNSELDEANKVKAKFFAILSHDLRSPVANLLNFLHLQKEAPELLTPQMIAANQKRITESAEDLLETMESMLLWSKGQMQHFEPQAKSIEVGELFVYIQKFFAGTAGITFSFDNAQALRLVTDEDYLKTIMQNLTNNAVKALKKTPNAHIRWEARQENSQIILAIIDNGPGASAQQLNALYTDEAHIGTKTGLGLHLIRDLARAISCQVSVKSNLNEGMEFQLAFMGA